MSKNDVDLATEGDARQPLAPPELNGWPHHKLQVTAPTAWEHEPCDAGLGGVGLTFSNVGHGSGACLKSPPLRAAIEVAK